MPPTKNQYNYKIVSNDGKWGILMENASGSSAKLLYEKLSEQEALATMEYIQTCRIRKVTSIVGDRWF